MDNGRRKKKKISKNVLAVEKKCFKMYSNKWSYLLRKFLNFEKSGQLTNF